MKTLSIIYLIFLFVIFIIGLVRFKKAAIPFKILILFIGVTLIQEIAVRVAGKFMHNNMFIFHIISPIEFLVFTSIYYYYLKGNVKKALLYLVLPVLLFALVNSFYIENIHIFPSNFLLLIQIIYCVYGLLGFRQMLIQPSEQPLYKQSFFWLNLALIIFATTLFFYFGLANYSVKHHLTTRLLFIFNYSIQYVYYILIAIAIIAETNTPKTSLGRT